MDAVFVSGKNVFFFQLGDKRKPVIVWIHPLRFTEESAFGPQYFGVGQYMQEDVVLVTVRYRQNVLGKLSVVCTNIVFMFMNKHCVYVCCDI